MLEGYEGGREGEEEREGEGERGEEREMQATENCPLARCQLPVRSSLPQSCLDNYAAA